VFRREKKQTEVPNMGMTRAHLIWGEEATGEATGEAAGETSVLR
jgi:hypothetical protein